MRKKVLFMIINMNIGGTEKALLNMIAKMPKHKYDITILMLEKYGDLLNYIPDHVQVKYIADYPYIKELLNAPSLNTAVSLMKRGKWLNGVCFSFVMLIAKVFKNKGIFFKYLLKNVPKMKSSYDVAIAYAGPMDLISFFVMYKIIANKKVQWIHFDVTKIGFDQQYAKGLYQKYDNIYTVSKEGKDKLTSLFPRLKSKIDAIPNEIPSTIVKMANDGEGFMDNFDGFRILTVGRLSKEKGQDLAIPVLARLKEQGNKIRWYCVGEGKDRIEFEKLIDKYNVNEDFILLGAHTNPYPFMKQCDIYVQPSRHEGFCITLGEAKCFGKPIITTNFTGSHEQIVHMETGLIVNVESEEIYQAVNYLIHHDEIRDQFKENLVRKNNQLLK